jgi:hypothetical protein
MMAAAQPRGEDRGPEDAPHFIDDALSSDAQAWEQVDTGRYMPRRIRGSYRGRALG